MLAKWAIQPVSYNHLQPSLGRNAILEGEIDFNPASSIDQLPTLSRDVYMSDAQFTDIMDQLEIHQHNKQSFDGTWLSAVIRQRLRSSPRRR